MLRIVVFELVQLGTTAYALWRGGAPERWTGALLLAAAWLSLAAAALSPGGFRTVSLYLLVVDLALTLAVLGVALRANRWWPLWAAALQCLALGVHGVRAYDPQIVPIVYSRLIGEIAYPICLTLVVGTWNFRQRCLAGGRRPAAWSPLRW